MYFKNKYITVFILSFSFIFSEAFIKGIVKDSQTQKPLIGASVFIVNTDQGSPTDIDGAYLIPNVEACSSCTYKIKVLYIGYKEYSTTLKVDQNKEYTLDLYIEPSSLEVETTTVTAKKRVDKITDSPATIELVSAKDIKREESTNLGGYLKGLKGVDFTASGVNNYSISVRGFNSSFSSRLLTLTDGRVASIPALRVVNYSTVPQSSKDIESIEVVIGPSTALYGANAHSGVVNITSKSPAVSEGIDISASSSINDDRDLYKFSTRWAHKLSDKLSFKLSGMYLQAYEWEFISDEEYKRHKYPWTGHPSRRIDKKDNNPWGELDHNWDYVAKDTTYHNYYNGDANIEYDEYVDNANDCRTIEGYECELIEKYIGDGEPNDTGDPDNDGVMGEDWYNGYDDDGDGLVDEDFFFADGIDNDGDCPGDTNGDGIICGTGDENVDELIDWASDTWIDGVDNDGNGEVDDGGERYTGDFDRYNLPNWHYSLEFEDIIVRQGRDQQIFTDKYGNTSYNSWYNPNDPHIRGTHIYDEELVELLFDTYIYDFGDDAIPGDGYWDDIIGDNQFTPWEGNNELFGNPIPSESCFELIGGDGLCSESEFIPSLHDCGIDGICYDDQSLWDLGEGNGVFDSFDWDGNNEYSNGDNWSIDTWVDNGDGIPSEDEVEWEDSFPSANGIWDIGEEIYDYGQDGIPNTNDPGENDGVLIVIDNNELDGLLDIGDGCYGCFDFEPYEDLNENGIWEDGEPYSDTNNDGIYTPADYKDNFQDTYDIDGDGYEDYPDFEVKNSKTEIRFDYDPTNDLNLTYQSGYSVSKTNQVSGVGRYLADNYEYTYYQLRGRYKNWFSQLYINQGNSGDTRGYMLGDMIKDESRNIAFQLQNNLKFKNTKLVWGIDYFRTEANTNGTVLNDGPNGYDNDGDSWFTGNDKIDNDRDSDDFSDWGQDGIGPYLLDPVGNLVIDTCNSDWSDCEQIVNNQAVDAVYDSEYDLWFIDSDGDGQWTTDNPLYPFLENPYYTGPDEGEGNGIPDPGEPGVNFEGFIIKDQLDNDCDGCDFDGDGYPNFQEIQLNTNIYDPTSYPTAVDPLSGLLAFDELIDEKYCGSTQYLNYVEASEYSGIKRGRLWKCEEGVDELDEYEPVISNEMGFYFQTKTIPQKNKKFEIITAARFDTHDMLDEGIQFSPKFGLFYKPNNFQTFRITYGKAYNTPTAINLATDLFIGKRGFVDYFLRGNTDGTPYSRVGDEFVASVPQVTIDNQNYNLINISGAGTDNYWDNYTDRIDGAVYFLGFNTDFSDVPEFMPLDTALYTIWVPELADSGRIYTPLEALNISDVAPIKTEKIQTLEIGFKGFLTERIHASIDYYLSLYEDFFSAPTIITPLIIKRQFEDGIDITNFDNLDVVGMLPANNNGGNAPYATQWDGRDNDNDWHCGQDTDCPYRNYGYLDDRDDISPEFGIDFYDEFGWSGQEEYYIDSNQNGMWDIGEEFTDEDGSGNWNCIGCEGEWGYLDWVYDAAGDTLGYTILHPEDVINTTVATEYGVIDFGNEGPNAQYWTPVGIDEYSAVSGLSEAEMITSPLIDESGNPIVAPGFAYTPLHSVLAPMNYGEVTMQGIDLGLTYLIPQSKVAIDANFSFYNTTEYFNTLTLKNDPINAPKFKMNASVNWESPIGNFSFKYRHVDQFAWQDGIWEGTVGPYDLFDIYYNYKINKFLELNLTGLNIFDDRHKEMIGGAVMGRQIVMRMSASI